MASSTIVCVPELATVNKPKSYSLPGKIDKNSGELHPNEYVENQRIGQFKIIKTIGSGSSSTVVLAYNTEKSERVAIKIIKRKDNKTKNYLASDSRVYREAVISTLLSHPNIVRMLDFLHTEDYFFLIFEYIKGRQLYEVVLETGTIEEGKARHYFRQIVSAVDYIHRNCIAHRDLKIENIIIDADDNVKIIDFGLSNFYDNKILLNTFCGSLYFAAPELLAGKQYFGPEIDVWSLGVVLYVMICGKVPFDDDSVYVLQGKIKTAEFEFCKAVSNEAKELINGILVASPATRLSVENIKNSVWLNAGFENVVHNFMLERQPIKKLDKGFMKVICSVMSFQFSDIESELKAFAKISSDKYGSLDNIYWVKRPIVSLYYLLLENCSNKQGLKNIKVFSDSSIKQMSMPAILHNFLQFVLLGTNDEIYMRYFTKNVFKSIPSHSDRPSEPLELKIIWPCVRKSYLKGFFKGTSAKDVGTSNALRKKILDVFKRNDVIYEATESCYMCSYYDGEAECYFKVALYYNMILHGYFIIITRLNSQKESFKIINDLVIKDFIAMH